MCYQVVYYPLLKYHHRNYDLVVSRYVWLHSMPRDVPLGPSSPANKEGHNGRVEEHLHASSTRPPIDDTPQGPKRVR